ncbi:hypothetical protein C8N40_11348 [Pontibacter mucosus]|uniref:Uncharacterized protein n=1 Tax=Pontibacter mucosus TaxID=1649266 RepID=A0A2T5Y9T3_9BACT|nr:hypothetical protein C8N40_11348 [Pontibacter mucosus]
MFVFTLLYRGMPNAHELLRLTLYIAAMQAPKSQEIIKISTIPITASQKGTSILITDETSSP